jgi:arylsulfatase A-like enzyme
MPAKLLLRYVTICLTFCLFAAVAMNSTHAAAALKPNILLIVADDLGWADVGYHGSPIKTPNIDALCKAGVELNHHYVAPMCTPTRAALLTGRYWSRFGNTAPSNTRVLPWNTITLARALKKIGYHTAITGKWHLGSLPKWGPMKFGFDQSHGSLAGGVNPINHLYKHGQYSKTWHRNDKLIEEKGHVTDLIAAEAVNIIKTKRSKPLFLYVPFTAVHTPFDEPEKWLSSAAHLSKDRQQYGACDQHMDDAIGLMIQALRQKKQLDNTLIIFFSDNGGTNGDDSSRYPNTKPKGKIKGLNHPLRGWKTQVYEGGIRVPAFVYWQGKLKPRKVDAAVHAIDWMPTLCALTGYQPTQNLKWDGKNIWPLLTGQETNPAPRTLYCKGVRGGSAALIDNNWKLVVHGSKGKQKQELFNLESDPNEKHNLAAKHPDHNKSLLAKLKAEQAKDDDAKPTDQPS